jgi:hypothetical protein
MTSRPPLSSPFPSLLSSSSLQINTPTKTTTTGGKLSLFRTHRYQSWRSALGGKAGGAGVAAACGGGGSAKEEEEEVDDDDEGAGEMQRGEQQQRVTAPRTTPQAKPSRTAASRKKESRDSRGSRIVTAGFATFPVIETTQLQLTPATSATSSSARTAAPPAAAHPTATAAATTASTSACPMVEGGTIITATPEARRVMRHISGLGMEDPTLFEANNNNLRGRQARQRATDTDPMRFTEDHHGPVDTVEDAGAAVAAEEKAAGASLLLFQDMRIEDMRIEDMPLDMRSAMSVESDPTATFSASNGGVDVQMFHSSLGHITGWLPLQPLDDKVSKVKKSATSQQEEELDTEQLLQSLPCDHDEPAKEQEETAAADASKQGSSRTKNVLCDAMIEQALLGASLNSLQSLSLDELQMHSSLGHFANPHVFLAAAPSESSDEGGGGGVIKRSDRHSRRALTTARSVARIAVPPGSITRVASRRRHAAGSNPAYRSPSDWKDRLHQSMPMNVKLTSGGNGNCRDPAALSASAELSSSSICSRPARPEWKAPPSVAALSRSSLTLGHDADDDHRAETKGGGGDTITGGLKAHEEEPRHHPATLSPSLTRPAAAVVIIPKKRALPSIQCLFPEDSAPPSTTTTTMTATMASC